MITLKKSLFCCFTKKPGTNRSSFSCFYSVYFFGVLCYFRLFIEKKAHKFLFFCFHREKRMFTPFFPCLNFSILHNFTPVFLNYIRSNFRIYSWCILMSFCVV